MLVRTGKSGSRTLYAPTLHDGDASDDDDSDAVRASIRSNHLELNVLGSQPVNPSPLAGQAREALVRSSVPLAGEGETRNELFRVSGHFSGDEGDDMLLNAQVSASRVVG